MCHWVRPGTPRGTEMKWDTSADDVNLLGNNIDTIEKNTRTLIDAIKEVGLKVKVYVAASSPKCRKS
jgi:hypothetical protein